MHYYVASQPPTIITVDNIFQTNGIEKIDIRGCRSTWSERKRKKKETRHEASRKWPAWHTRGRRP
jgi:hypothetical protein